MGQLGVGVILSFYVDYMGAEKCDSKTLRVLLLKSQKFYVSARM